MSLHNMVGSPQRCRHVGPVVLHDAGAESGTPRGARGTDVWLQGRFPLMNESWTRRHGEINMRFRWTYANPATLAKAAKARQLLRPAPHYRPSAFTQVGTAIYTSIQYEHCGVLQCGAQSTLLIAFVAFDESTLIESALYFARARHTHVPIVIARGVKCW
jgi:hypothetical protein